jgi:chromosomal replication initiator protein
MSLVQDYHAEHKARQSRIEAKAFKLVAVEIVPEKIERIEPDPLRSLLTPAPEPRKLAIRDIQLAVARHYGLTLMELLANRRLKRLAFARQVAMYLCKELTPRSTPWIGRAFGGMDHTTVLYAIKKIRGLVLVDRALAETIQSIRASLPEYDLDNPEAMA